ncbi:MAG: NAD+ synthase [Candidatus Marinimicrobia bacterium]|jgi:NAD+ synthase (glutamine-hydrolysing)|nr:NAD+ synthase [Candidatus Neomarinimicrobiota bacterium]MBT3946659.1 NAD+ synthase [Candidatus Neomarinimicrobiota bacterium]MBT4065576.1 NAD+ synthase [Candidatus Neomarinimicrobiota bacterium]MBT4308637.1 NAD+ synthase [Candidatus Neomarinimicrobiota bacterium]MBT4453731.1 NAD+ synthase [Candidatus Neomarinimicrobiota bacterium]
MKITLCQINPTVGAINQNKKSIFDWYHRAVDLGADLVVFPELSLIGYPPQDLLLRNRFIENAKNALDEIAQKSTIPIILGNTMMEDNKLYNCAFFCEKGEIISHYKKRLLPTYDVFDEARYFTSGSEPFVVKVSINGENVYLGLQICEDLWDKNYSCDLVEELKAKGAEIIINLSASPYRVDRLLDRCELIQSKASDNRLSYLYCNLVGAQDELIFDGQSLAYNENGELIAQGKAFEEEILMVDVKNSQTIDLIDSIREEKIYNALVLGVKDYFKKTGHTEAVIGLSGGIDSSLTACIAVDALGIENVHGVSMPSKFSSQHSKDDAKLLSENLGIDYRTISIESIVSSFEESLKTSYNGSELGVAEENIQARARGSIIMALSNKFNWLVLSTGNKTELAMGYCTLYGDMNGGLAVISDLSKTDVYALSRWVNEKAGFDCIPINSIEKPPSAELTPNQVDPFDYDVVSPLVTALIDNQKSPSELIKEGADPGLVKDISNRIRINEYKRRQAAPGLRVTSKAFGIGRRVPIVNQFDELNND